jgi:tRNA (guanosine-2'-O-)-methyltransferase
MDNQIKPLIAYLSSFVTPTRLEKIIQVLELRTNHVTVVLEDIFQSHNASAVVRSVECMGVQSLHVVEKQFAFKPAKGVAMGSAQWLDIHHYKMTTDCFKQLKSDGYKLVATTPHGKAYTLSQLPIDTKCALIFGTENVGLSKDALEHADEFVTIPMYGFTQSYNVSVSVALCLYDIISRLRKSEINWQLNQDEKQQILLEWLRRTIPGADAIERNFFKEQK